MNREKRKARATKTADEDEKMALDTLELSGDISMVQECDARSERNWM